MQSIQDKYDQAIERGDLIEDLAQRAILPQFERIRTELLNTPKARWWSRTVPVSTKGLYLWGGVGRGKSMLMDLLVDAVDAPKRRVHFHAFMQWVHAEISRYREEKVSDPVAKLVEKMVSEIRFLALDEMQITDIADAMIVGRVFEGIFEAGVAVVTTSNRPPADLYKNGLNRNLFLPFVDTLQAHMAVEQLDAKQDYRQDRLKGRTTYFSPLDNASRAGVDAVWHDLTHGFSEELIVKVKTREIRLPRFHNAIARASFFDLCGQPLGAGDYLAISDVARVLILDNIPLLGRNNFNEAKRFVTLIDVIYEAKMGFICSAAALPEMLYVEGAGSFEFARTASRLHEMQSIEWIDNLGGL